MAPTKKKARAKREGKTNVREKGTCRCCLTEGSYKDMQQGYFWLGEQEFYQHMLEEAFNISLVDVRLDEGLSNKLICGVCICRLRDALNFKRQILDSEKWFLNQGYVVEVKTEQMKLDVDVKVELLEEDSPLPEQLEGPVSKLVQQHDADSLATQVMVWTDDDECDVISNSSEQLGPAPPRKDDPLADNKKEPAPYERLKPVCVIQTLSNALNESDGAGVIRTGRSIYCDVCRAEYADMSQKEHSVAVHDECFNCTKQFNTGTQRDEHFTAKHKGESPNVTCKKYIRTYKCPYCDSSFDRFKKGLMHIKAEHKNQCPRCMDKFKTIFVLKSHLRSAHDVKIDFSLCNACGKEYPTQYELEVHQRRFHLKERDNKCTQCDMKFFTNARLKMHMITHGVIEKTYKCDVCGKVFPRKNTLNYHMRIHTNDKRAVCKVCGEAFVQRASLKYHLENRHPDVEASTK